MARFIVCRIELNAFALGEGEGGRFEGFGETLPLKVEDLLGVNESDMLDRFEVLVETPAGFRLGVKERKNDQSDSN